MSQSAFESVAGLAAVRSWCGWHLWPSVSETLRVESSGGRTLTLPSLHVTDVFSVRDEAGEVVDGSAWKWRANGIIRGCWKCEERYEIDLQHGYDEMPDELVAIINQIDAEGLGKNVRSQSAGPFATSYGTADLESQPFSVRAVVGRYALPPRP